MGTTLKKVFVIILAVFLLCGMWGCTTSEKSAPVPAPSPAEEGTPAPVTMKPVELSFSHFFPPVHPVETELVPQWAAAVEEATGGLVKIVSYPGQTLLNGPETYEGVKTGIADVGLSVFGYTPGRFPLIEAYELPGVIYKNSKVASYCTWEGIKEIQPQEVQDTKLMFAFATGPGHLMTQTPVRTLEDIQGMELRAFGLTVETLEALGAVPVAMPQAEVYEAAARGIVKGNLAPIEVLQGFRQAEVTDYITYTPFLYNATFFVTMNLDVWNSFPKEIQDKILEVNEKIFTEVAAGLWDSLNISALEFAIKETGQEVLPELSPTETARWIEKVLPIQEKYIKSVEERGLPGKEMLEMIKNLSEKYNEIYG